MTVVEEPLRARAGVAVDGVVAAGSDGLVGEVSGRPVEWLEAEIATLAGHIAAATCRLLVLIGELDRREGWRSWECQSCAHWLSWRIGMSPRTAREHVRVARALEELPVTTAAFAAGRLSYSKVRSITRTATPRTEADLVGLAIHATASHMDRIAAGYCRAKRNADPDRGAAQERRRGVWSHTDDDGSRTLMVRGGPEEIARILAAIHAAEPEVPELVDGPDQPHAARRFEALVEVADAYLAAGDASCTHDDTSKATSNAGSRTGSRTAARGVGTELVVHAELDTLVAGAPGRADLDHGSGLAHTVLERIACDCAIRVSVERDGTSVDIGRRSRVVPAGMTRVIRDRDQDRCRFPGCTHQGRLQIHHREPWSRGGPTATPNLFLVCRYHHKVLHEGRWHATGDANGRLTFHAPDGRTIPETAPPGPRTHPDALGRNHALSGVTIGADTITSRWDGTRLDLGWTIAALWHLDPPHPS